MKLQTTTAKVVQTKDVPGLFTCRLDHEIKATIGTGKYTGPKFPEQMWNEVLAFLRWVNDTWRSEAQLRLFVNRKENTWKAWAFPQEGDTGMSAKELDTPEAKEQRMMFGDDDLYFATVHSHCEAGAFQSSADEFNEKTQDGIHITIGKLKSKQFDIHSRFYWAGNKFVPDLSDFYDVDDLASDVPKWAHQFMMADTMHQLAVWKMTQPPEESQTFPEQWKTNIVIRRPVSTVYAGSPASTHGMAIHHYNKRSNWNTEHDFTKAVRHFYEIIRDNRDISIDDFVTQLHLLNDPVGRVVVQFLQDNEITVGPFLPHLEAQLDKIAESDAKTALIDAQAEVEDERANGKGKKRGKKNKELPLLTSTALVEGQPIPSDEELEATEEAMLRKAYGIDE